MMAWVQGRGWELALLAVVAAVLLVTWMQAPSGTRRSGDSEASATSLPFEVWMAQGFGVGWIPWAPGTFGSVLGLVWTGVLLRSGSWVVLVAGIVGGFAASVWMCDRAENWVGRKDPGSVVLDEIAAVPLCFVVWLAILHTRAGELPPPMFFLSGSNWVGTLAVFAAFRFFDVVKPWPVRQSQGLRGGWGVTVDDFLAAGYVNVVVLLYWLGKRLSVEI